MPRTAGTDHKLSLACSRAALPHCHTAALPHRCDWHKVQFLVKSEAALCAAHRMPPAVPCLRTSVSTSPSVSAIPSASASASTCNIYNCGLPAPQPPSHPLSAYLTKRNLPSILCWRKCCFCYANSVGAPFCIWQVSFAALFICFCRGQVRGQLRI